MKIKVNILNNILVVFKSHKIYHSLCPQNIGTQNLGVSWVSFSLKTKLMFYV